MGCNARKTNKPVVWTAVIFDISFAKYNGISCVRIVICVTLSSTVNPQIVMILHFVAPFTGLHISFALRAFKIAVKQIDGNFRYYVYDILTTFHDDRISGLVISVGYTQTECCNV
jgi:uncharacterized Tic20 family protein